MLDLAWICGRCGHIILGPPAVPDGGPFPATPRHRCSCGAFSWHESAVEPLDYRALDNPGLLLDKGRRRAPPRRAPNPLSS